MAADKKPWFYVLTIILTIGFLATGIEFFLRVSGFEPWHRQAAVAQSFGMLFGMHPELGFVNQPGSHRARLPGADYSYRVTITDAALRITRPVGKEMGREPIGEIWVFGCSFTYGWGLNDDETYPWLLQEKLPRYRIVNFGTNGYGTLQSLIQFRKALEGGKAPRIAVIAYMSALHDERNVLSRSWRKTFAAQTNLEEMPIFLPRAKIGETGQLSIVTQRILYRAFPLMESSALLHFIENRYNQLEKRLLKSGLVSEKLLTEFAESAKKRGAVPVVACLHERDLSRLHSFGRLHAIPVVDISVDYSLAENRLSPQDPHPSAMANRKIADKLYPFLSEILNARKLTP